MLLMRRYLVGSLIFHFVILLIAGLINLYNGNIKKKFVVFGAHSRKPSLVSYKSLKHGIPFVGNSCNNKHRGFSSKATHGKNKQNVRHKQKQITPKVAKSNKKQKRPTPKSKIKQSKAKKIVKEIDKRIEEIGIKTKIKAKEQNEQVRIANKRKLEALHKKRQKIKDQKRIQKQKAREKRRQEEEAAEAEKLRMRKEEQRRMELEEERRRIEEERQKRDEEERLRLEEEKQSCKNAEAENADSLEDEQEQRDSVAVAEKQDEMPDDQTPDTEIGSENQVGLEGNEPADDDLGFNLIGEHGKEDILVYQKHVQHEVDRLWRPPLGVPKGTICTVLFSVDNGGSVEKCEFVKRSNVLIYDLSIMQVAKNFQFNKCLWGKQFKIDFRQ